MANERPTKQTTSSVFSASIRLTILRMTCGLDKAIKISAYPGIPLENKLFTLLFNAIGLFNLDWSFQKTRLIQLSQKNDFQPMENTGRGFYPCFTSLFLFLSFTVIVSFLSGFSPIAFFPKQKSYAAHVYSFSRGVRPCRARLEALTLEAV